MRERGVTFFNRLHTPFFPKTHSMVTEAQPVQTQGDL
jgi:hypothetical protein